jgi:hypothetical protein
MPTAMQERRSAMPILPMDGLAEHLGIPIVPADDILHTCCEARSATRPDLPQQFDETWLSAEILSAAERWLDAR